MGLNQRHRTLWPRDRHRNARKSGTGAYVRNAQISLRKVSCKEQGFTIVAFNDFFRFFDASEVENPVPATEQIEMPFQLLNLKGGEFNDRAKPLAQQLSKHGQYSGRRLELR